MIKEIPSRIRVIITTTIIWIIIIPFIAIPLSSIVDPRLLILIPWLLIQLILFDLFETFYLFYERFFASCNSKNCRSRSKSVGPKILKTETDHYKVFERKIYCCNCNDQWIIKRKIHKTTEGEF